MSTLAHDHSQLHSYLTRMREVCCEHNYTCAKRHAAHRIGRSLGYVFHYTCTARTVGTRAHAFWRQWCSDVQIAVAVYTTLCRSVEDDLK